MLKLFINAWKVKEIRAKLLYTLLILAIVRLGAHIALPGIDLVSIKAGQEMFGSGTLYNIIAGGYNSRFSIFSMGIGPYITASIIMQLLTVAIPKIEQLHKEGEAGRKKITTYTRYLTIALSAIQGIGVTASYSSMFLSDSIFLKIASVICLVAGSSFVMWMAEQITQKGLSNGSSMIIFVNIVSNMPSGISALVSYSQGGDPVSILKIIAILLILVVDLVFIVYINQGERRIPVQYSTKMGGRRTFGGQGSFMPIKVNTAGVIAIIFALSLLQFPEVLSQFVTPGATYQKVIEVLSISHPVGAVLYVILILFFSYFYTSIVINPNEIAENMKKNGGFIPGIRPGQPTSAFITRVVNRITLIGAIVLLVWPWCPLCFSGSLD